MNRVPRVLRQTEDLLRLPIRDQDILLARAAALRGIRQTIPADSVFARVEQQSRRSPQAIAVIDDRRTLTYKALVSTVRGLAASLSASGIRAGDIVAVGGARGAGSPVAFLAIETLGAVYTPVDHHWPQARIEHILASTEAAALIVPEEIAPLEGLSAAAQTQHCPVLTVDWRIAGEGEVPCSPICAPDTPKYVLFTSGSTGVPKGAIIEHQGMMNHIEAKIADMQIGSADCVAQSAPLTFDVSIWQMLAPLVAGASVTFLNDDEIAQPHRLIEAVRTKGVTILELVPSMLRLVMDEVEASGGADLGSLRSLLTVGEALPPSLARRWMSAFANIPLVNVYGPTELSDNVTHHTVVTLSENEFHTPIGRPIPNVSLYVLREQAGHYVPCAHGEEGELFAGGVCVGRGYLGDEGRTRAAFFLDPLSETPTGRLYRTGDLVRYAPDRGLEYLGRIDRQAKIRGVRIEPGEIEETLRKHPDVSDAAVLVVDKDTENASIVACVCGTRINISDVRAYAVQQLPTSMVPRRIVQITELPVTPNGKVDYGELAKLLSNPTHETKAISVDQELLGTQVRTLRDSIAIHASDTVGLLSWPSSQYVLQALAVLASGATVLVPEVTAPDGHEQFWQSCHRDAVSIISTPAEVWNDAMENSRCEYPQSLRHVVVSGNCADTFAGGVLHVTSVHDLGGVLFAVGSRLPEDLGARVLDSQMRQVPQGEVGHVFLLGAAPQPARTPGSMEERTLLPTGRLGRYAEDGTIELVENV